MSSGGILTIAFDANGLERLCANDEQSREALERLKARVKARTARVIAGHPLMAELSCMGDRIEMRRQVRELQALTGGRLLLTWEDRVPLEMRHRRALPGLGAFRPMKHSRQIFTNFLTDDEIVDGEAAKVERAKKKYAEGMTAAKADFRAEAGRLQKGNEKLNKQWSGRFARAPDKVIDEWFAEPIFRKISAQYGIATPAKWPAPKEVPSLRAEAAYHVTHLHTYALDAKGGNQKIDPNDYYDNRHFIDAVYADVLVTNDGGFHTIASAAGNTGVTLQRFNPWAAEFIASPTRCPAEPDCPRE